MKKSIIPPTPTKDDYTVSGDYIDVAAANAVDIFDCENPFDLFAEWMSTARASEVNDANAMSLATVDGSGLPDVRMILLKGMDARGFTFYTHEDSAKGQQLKANGKAALCFHWKSLRRQVRVRGAVVAVKDKEADDYFASRARGSQLGAWSSDQSRPVKDRDALEDKVAETKARFGDGDIARPEFWRDRPFRLHDRLVFKRSGKNQSWTRTRLFP